MIRPLRTLSTDSSRARNCKSYCGQELSCCPALDLRPLYILVLFLGCQGLPVAVDVAMVVSFTPIMPLVILRSFIAWAKVDTIVRHCLSLMGKGVW